MSEWKTIDSAPKSEIDIDCWVETLTPKGTVNGERLIGVRWQKDEKHSPTFAGGAWVQWGRYSGEWDTVEDGAKRITHWMPQPRPPEKAQ